MLPTLPLSATRPLIGLFCLMLLGGCATQAPSIAHTHIGHALDGWRDTPDQAGLFVTAEKAAEAALESAQAAVGGEANLLGIKQQVVQVMSQTNPEYQGRKPKAGEIQYGVKKALAEASQHVTFAAQSADASANIKHAAKVFHNNSRPVLNRCDLIMALGDEILSTNSIEEAGILSQELLKLARANVEGEERNGDGIVGSVPEEYGLKQLRQELEATVAREAPPYRTVDTWYLLNLIRLPSGEWRFRQAGEAGDYDAY